MTAVYGASRVVVYSFFVATAIQKQFGQVVKRRRLEAGLSQEKLASASGLHFTYISLLESGKRLPSIEVGRKLAAGFGTTMVSLIQEVEQASGEATPRATKRKK